MAYKIIDYSVRGRPTVSAPTYRQALEVAESLELDSGSIIYSPTPKRPKPSALYARHNARRDMLVALDRVDHAARRLGDHWRNRSAARAANRIKAEILRYMLNFGQDVTLESLRAKARRGKKG